ncbi:MAG: hypothetical protein PHT78_11760 [Desulfitobacteriaceae bacterium]|nr:hypothetical protein [Desulfitobacteriaceae bacterium]MDD3874885.1 hypothetical protein [Methanosarcina sp.]MDD4753899.1 hypothetical protein [Desulfitobacteriaceae bacterium]
MEDKDLFRKLIKDSLEEETKEIYFSPQAREKVRQKVTQNMDHSPDWWNRPISLSMRALSLSLIALLLVATFYTRTLFYISEKDMAKFEMREKIIIHDVGVPFGAVQHLTLALEKGKGGMRP